jgi:hypothetical protein
MNCQQFWDTMPELSNEAPAGEACAHRERCPSCAALLDGYRGVAEGLGRVAAESRRMVAPARVEARVMANYRAHAGVRMHASAHWWVPLVTWSAASAATVGLALALVLVHGRQPTAKTSPAEGVPHRRPAARMQLASLPAPDLDLMQADAMQTSTEAEAGFIPLPNAEELGPNDEVGVVRLEVPRSAMAALGFVVTAERASETVEADVEIGPDGLAHAVRFVDRSRDF